MERYIPTNELAQFAAETAETLPVTGAVSGRAEAREVRRAISVLVSAQGRYRAMEAGGEALPGAGQWILDNLYLARQAAQEVCPAYTGAGRLRATSHGALISAVCEALLAAGDGDTDEERIFTFLTAFQERTVLERKELGLITAGLRRAAILTLAQIYKEEAPEANRCGVLFNTLRRLSTLELASTLEAADRVEQLLRRDTAGVYPFMEESSRQDYRRQVAALAKEHHMPEHRVAETALELSARGETERTRHVGFYLFDRPLGRPTRRSRGLGYVAANVLLTLGLAGALWLCCRSLAAGLLSLLPLSQIVKESMDRVLLSRTTPRPLPRLALENGVPAEGKTVCVISVLLTGEKPARNAVRHLEEYRMASQTCGGNLLFGLLCDLPESREVLTAEDKRLLEYTGELVEQLNARYGGGFYLFCRERVWNRDTKRFAPWERKRGATLELCRLLAGAASGLEVRAGDKAMLSNTRYVLTLDADTRLEPESARALIGTALHPLNRPITDLGRGVVVRGHGVLHPRIAVSLESSTQTPFAKIFAPQGGADPYGASAGEVYMDRFQSGGFAGKGLIHVQAYLDCLDRDIPEGRVLSHDALEGAYLRGGYVNDVELTDGFPASAMSWFVRQHRWIRGDWQNLPWLFRRGRGLPLIERWRLFDSLRRSLLPVGLLAGLCAWLFAPTAAACAAGIVTVLALFSSLLEGSVRFLFRSRRDGHVRLHSPLLYGAGGALVQVMTRVFLLPYEAWVSLSAIGTSLWRMGISHKNLLQWQTAEQSDAASRGGIGSYYKEMWFSVLWGCMLLVISPLIPGLAMGTVWLCAPLFAASLSQKPEAAPALSPDDQDWLRRRSAEIWRYFREQCTPEDHFLPPDNVQYAPPAESARRVSPTNLGLALLSALCALKLGVAPEQEALGLCENLLATAERLPKWRGHLYNWYDTRTMRPLAPEYISTVDSGNLAGCLIAVAEALRELGAHGLAQRAESLYRAMDFRPLYDEKRHLFRIGLVPGEETAPESWYDLLESEERLTGYIAIALQQVPKKHWQRLSRARVGRDGFRGMVSWTGTMFEYLMPELLLPLYNNSHLMESARFALYVQRQTTAGPDKLWGMSESAFAALDASGHYRYKAHGAPGLALCRNMHRDLVISPYSSYLALLASPRSAIKNLRKLERPEYTGPYGFWEAIDFTPGRAASDQGAVVGCVMVHHLGMSLAAIANVLCDNAVRKWFLADPAMAAYTSLLQEKVPLGGALLRLTRDEAPRRPRTAAGAFLRQGDGTDFWCPQTAALSNGAYHLFFTESGVSRGATGGLLPYRTPSHPLGEGHGIEVLLRREEGLCSLLPEPGQQADYRWEFSGGEASLTGKTDAMEWTVTAGVAPSGGEWRRVTLRRGENPGSEALYFSLEPVLIPEKDYRAHPSFGRLGLYTREREGTLSVRRLSRGSQSERYMALACDRAAEYSSDFRHFPTRGGDGEFIPNTGWQSESRITTRVLLPAGETVSTVTFALCVAGDEDAAVSGARNITRETAGFSMADVLSVRWGVEEHEFTDAMALLPCLLWPHVALQGSELPAPKREALWRLGISGDVPIHGVECIGAQSVAAAVAELRRFALLRQCGVSYDLVFLTDDEGDYRRVCRAALESAMEKLELGGLIGARGGVHFVSLRDDRETLLSASALWSGKEGLCLPDRQAQAVPRYPLPQPVRQSPPEYDFDSDGRFSFTVNHSLPSRCWSNMLVGGDLGWFATDSGTGSMWYKNARECPILPWHGDPLTTQGPEQLWAEINGRAVSFFAAPDDTDCRVTYGFGEAVWEKTVDGVTLRLTAFVPPERPIRVFLLESSAPVTVRWCAPLQLAAEPEDAPGCFVTREGDAFTAENPRCPFPELRLTARCSQSWESFGTDAAAFLLEQDAVSPRSGSSAFGGSFMLENTAVLLCGTVDDPGLLAEDTARKTLEVTRQWWRQRVCRLQGQGMDSSLVPLLNGWIAYQALACRLLGRSSVYQSGGAMGFRDQLQDAVNLLWLDTANCRAHILACCAHQYSEGDVQHWWHAGVGPTDKGVRTRCSDDLLWLPWAVCEYVTATGDADLCRETVGFLTSPALRTEEDSRYELPDISGDTATVLEHCHRAIAQVLQRGLGAHRLLLMGSGDWNDGFDAMGPGAESVWLTWFASTVCDKFAALLRSLGEGNHKRYEDMSAALGAAANEAWDGDHYLRGYYGDGEPLGSSGSDVCRIDSVAQSFAAFCPHADPQRVNTALDTALGALWDREHHRIALYTPPVGPRDRSPGYVRTYGPGFRENGGQYTHAAVWLARACFRTGRWGDGYALLRDMALACREEAYGAEPYVLPADVYTAPGMEGRAGWSWYTGAAGWWYRVAWQDMLGFSLQQGTARFDPPVPVREKGWTLQWREGNKNALTFPPKMENNS